MNQPQMEFPPAARRVDPDTSKLADEATNRTKGVEEILSALGGNHWTAMEIADFMIHNQGFPWWKAENVSKRCSDAISKGLVERLPRRPCSVTGRQAHPLKITIKGRMQ